MKENFQNFQSLRRENKELNESLLMIYELFDKVETDTATATTKQMLTKIEYYSCNDFYL